MRAPALRLIGAALLASAALQPATAAPPDAARMEEIVRLVRQDCGSCHGMTLKGGLGPALLPEALADKPAESLVATVLNGRPGTPMPPWNRFLSAAEAQWIVDALQRGLPEEQDAAALPTRHSRASGNPSGSP